GRGGRPAAAHERGSAPDGDSGSLTRGGTRAWGAPWITTSSVPGMWCWAVACSVRVPTRDTGAPALVPRVRVCRVCGLWRGFFPARLGRGALAPGAGCARRGRGPPRHPPHTRYEPAPAALWTRAPCLTWRGGRGRFSHAL